MTQRLSILAVSALLGALALPAVAQKSSGDTSGATMHTSPGKATLLHERTIVATVEEVDAAKGHVTLKGPNGHIVPLTVGPRFATWRRSRSATRFACATPRRCR